MSIYTLSDVGQVSSIAGGCTIIGGILNLAHETNSSLLNRPTHYVVAKDLQNIKNIIIIGKNTEKS